MRINMSLVWESAPTKGRIEIENGTLLNGIILVGTGEYDRAEGRFRFSNTDRCQMCFAIVLEDSKTEAIRTTIKIVDTRNPFEFALRDVLNHEDSSMRIADVHVTVTAEVDRLAGL